MNQLSILRLCQQAASRTAGSGRLLAYWLKRARRDTTMADASAGLNTSAESLQQVAADLEQHFLATSANLETLAAKGELFVQESEKLVNIATGRMDGSTLYFEAMHLVEQPLKFLNESQAQSAEFLRGLQRDSDRIEDLIHTQTDLQHTIAPLKYIQTLFKIESAPLGVEVQVMFASLTKEIETMHDQISELFSTKFIELRNIQRTVNEVIRELQIQTSALGKTISKERTQIDQSLQKLQRELLDNQQRESRISRLSLEVNQEIQQVVTGLQYQDIINQKLQHNWTALSEIETQIGQKIEPALLAQSCRLEAEQIQAARHDLASAQTAIQTGTEKILAHLVNADSHCISLEEFQQLTVTSDGMAQVLFDIFATLRLEISATVASSSKAFEKLQPITSLASNLTLIVRDLSQRIHLIGLNAQIQAALVDKGVGLEVLSARTSEISRATNQISESIASQLDQLVSGLAQSVKAMETMHGEANRQQAILNNEGAAAETKLHALRDAALATMLRVSTILDDVRLSSQTALDTLDYVQVCDGTLAHVQTNLQAIAQTFSDNAKARSSKSAEFVLPAPDKYTMASERKIYAQVMNDQTLSAETAPESTVELFDQVEFPADQPAEAASEPDFSFAPAEPAEPLETIESEESSAPTAENQTAPRPQPPTDFGNNVELF